MKIDSKGKILSFRLTEDSYLKLVSKAIEVSQEKQKITSVADILNGLIGKIKLKG
jgi:hypothetical protein